MQRHTYKVLLVGDSGVGKSTILSSYRGERFNPCYVQTREREIKKANIQVGKTAVELQIWDTPGNNQCRTVTAAYMCEDVKGVIFVFDVTNDETYFNVQHWINTFRQFAGNEHVKFVFVGNKTDVGERKVFEESGQQLAKQHNGVYVDASAKRKQNIDQIFNEIAQSILGVESEKHDSLTRERDLSDLSIRSYEGERGFFQKCVVL